MNELHNIKCADCNCNHQVTDSKYYCRTEKTLCPNCGSKYKIVTIELSDNLEQNIHDSFSLGSTDIRTNRTTLEDSDETPTNTILIIELLQDYIKTGDEKKLIRHFEPLVKQFSFQWDSEIICYRGVSKDLACKFKSKQISPTPKEYAQNNRYSQKNERAFYLIDNPKYIKNEIELNEWIEQKYILVPSMYNLKLADVTASNKELHNDLAHIFKISESGKSSTGIDFEKMCKEKYDNRYLISQFIAKLFKKYNWDGLIIPGIHGNSDENYNNIVIFERALESWQSWCDGEFCERLSEKIEDE